MKKLCIYFIFCILFSGCESKPDDSFTVRNDSNFNVKRVRIEVCKQKFTTENLLPNEKMSFNYNAKFDSDYEVIVEFENSKELTGNLGYVCRGFSFDDLIIIKSNDLNFIPNGK